MTAAILLSGGMDSTALAYWLRPQIAITVAYGQRCATGEIDAASAVCGELSITHEVLRIDCSALGSGDLSGRPPLGIAPVPEWWPFRNQLLITLGGIRALELGASELIVGSVRNDVAHCDGRAEFFAAMSQVTELQEGCLRVSAPAIHLSSVELIRTSGIPLSVLAWAHSCHLSDFACGQCRGCNKHRETMQELEQETP